MQPAPIPSNESERLAAVRRYDVIDTPAESDCDDFTRIASHEVMVEHLVGRRPHEFLGFTDDLGVLMDDF